MSHEHRRGNGRRLRDHAGPRLSDDPPVHRVSGKPRRPAAGGHSPVRGHRACGSSPSRSTTPPSAPSSASCSAIPSRAARSWSGPAWRSIESDLIGVELPEGPKPLLQVCTGLLQAEVNIVQAYPLMIRPHGRPAVALMVDNLEMAHGDAQLQGLYDDHRAGSDAGRRRRLGRASGLTACRRSCRDR